MKKLILIMILIVMTIISCKKEDSKIQSTNTTNLSQIEGRYIDIGQCQCTDTSVISSVSGVYWINGLDYWTCNYSIKMDIVGDHINIDYNYVHSTGTNHVFGTGNIVGDTIYINCTNGNYIGGAVAKHKYYRIK